MRTASRSFESDHLILLAPPFGDWSTNFDSFEIDSFRYERLMADAQRLRGQVYLQDGAINPRQLTLDGRLVHPHDEQSWQLLVMNADGGVSGCARYSPKEHDVSFSELGVAGSALAHCPSWGDRLRRAVESKRAEAARRGYGYAELGGWALIEKLRYTPEAVRISMNVYALMKLFGGALAVTTATVRHRSSSILRKLGGLGFSSGGVELPSYYDPQYNCEMEILSFDSDHPNPKYSGWIQECHRKLKNLTVLCADPCEIYDTPTLEYEMAGHS
jgi:hypothetical protein